MPPGSGRRIDEIEVLRAIAALMLVVAHIPLNLLFWRSQLGDFIDAWWNPAAGIDLFFAISGYVVTRNLLPDLHAGDGRTAFAQVTLGFLLDRFWRVLPLLALWVAAPVAVGAVVNRSGAFHPLQANLAAGLSALLGFANIRFAALFGHGDAGLSFPAWSLSLELQFYGVLALLALLRRGWLAALMLALLAWQFVMPADPIWYATRPGALAAGVLLAIFGSGSAQAAWAPEFLRRGVVRLACVAGALILIGALESDLPRPLVAVPYGLASVLSAALVFAASFDRGYLMPPCLAREALVWLGARSYAITLVHLPAFALTREFYRWVSPPGLFHSTQEASHSIVVAATLTLVLSELSHRFVERPCRQYGRGLRLAATSP